MHDNAHARAKPRRAQYSIRAVMVGVAVGSMALAVVAASWRDHLSRQATAKHLRSRGILVAGPLSTVSITGVQTDEEMANLVSAMNKGGGPTRLTLMESEITDLSCKHIAELPRLTSLTIDSPNLTDTGLEALAGRKWDTMRIYRGQITLGGLTRLLQRTRIRELDLAEIPLTTEEVASLRREFSDVRIVYD